jgi:hypothetical protein
MSKNPELTIIEKYSVFLLLLIPFMIGIFLLVIGFTHPSGNQGVLFGIGGTFLGSSLGTGLSRLAGERQNRNLWNYLSLHRQEFLNLHQVVIQIPEKILNFPMMSTEKDLLKFRRLFHRYHKTRFRGQDFWIYTPMDFSRQIEQGHLRAARTIPMHGVNYELDNKGYIIGNIFILTSEPIGFWEPRSLEVYPTFGGFIDLIDGFWGVFFHPDWDGNNLSVDPCLILADPCPGTGTPGRQTVEVGVELERRWTSSCCRIGMFAEIQRTQNIMLKALNASSDLSSEQ